MTHLMRYAAAIAALSSAALALAPAGCSGAAGIGGLVTDRSGNPLSAVTVSAHGKTTTTSDDGTFSLSGGEMPADRIVVSFDRSGYFSAMVGAIPARSGTTNVKAVLVEREELGTVDADEGGAVSGAEMNLVFPPGSFIGEDGSAIHEPVKLYGAFFNPDDEGFGSVMPGGDFAAKDGSGTSGVLTSFGAVAVEAETASGKQAKVVETVSGCVSVPLSMLGSAPSTMPVWVLNSVTAKWESVSEATLQGNAYCFDILALGRINCDIFSRFAFVHGRVCSDGDPLGAVAVNVGQAITMTSSEGEYTVMVPSGVTVGIKTTKGQISVGPLSPDEDATVADIGDCGGGGSGGQGGGGPAGCGVLPGGCVAGMEPAGLRAGCCSVSQVSGCGTMGACVDSCATAWYELNGQMFGPCEGSDEACIWQAAEAVVEAEKACSSQ